MDFQVTFPFNDNSSLKDLGVGACMFVSGGLASYILFQYFPALSETENLSYMSLADQMNDLKVDIKQLKGRLASALAELTQEAVQQKEASLVKIAGSDTLRPSHGDPLNQILSDSYPRSPTPFSKKIYDQAKKTIFGSGFDNRLSKLPERTPSPIQTPRSSRASRYSQQQSPRTTADYAADEDEFISVTNFMDTAEQVKESEVLQPVLDEIDYLSMGPEADKEKAMVLLRENEETHPNHWAVKWRLARGHLALYGASEDQEIKRMHAMTALKYAKEALNTHKNSPDVHKWFAVSLAANLDFQNLAEKNANSEVIKNHLERAIELDPLEPMPHFMRGKWCWGLYKLKWIEKKLTGALYGAPPSVSIEDIIESFMKAEDLAPGFYKANRLYLGKCYLEKGDLASAKNWFSAGIALPIKTKEDARTQESLHKLMKRV